MQVDEGTTAYPKDSGEMRCEMVVTIESGPAFELKWCPLPSNDRIKVRPGIALCVLQVTNAYSRTRQRLMLRASSGFSEAPSRTGLLHFTPFLIPVPSSIPLIVRRTNLISVRLFVIFPNSAQLNASESQANKTTVAH